MSVSQDLLAFVESLNSAGAKYVIVGGYAVAFHGHPRFTGDIDFFVEASPENAAKITHAIDLFGFSSLGLKPEDFTRPNTIIQLGFPPNRIDIINNIDAVTFDEAWSSRLRAHLDGHPVAYISKELLIRNKTAANRPKDLGDVGNL